LIIRQAIIEAENRINFLAGRFPQRVERDSAGFIDLTLHALSVGLPAQLLQNRPDVRHAERELAAAGLDVSIARKNFYPKLFITAGLGYEAFNPKYLYLTPASLVYNVAGNLVAPLINKTAIRADYLTANARQLQAVYDYQRVILNAFTEVVNRVSKVQNFSGSIAIKKQQVKALETSVDVANNLFLNARIEYLDVLFAQRDMFDAKRDLIDDKKEQLSAIVNAYQALGGGMVPLQYPEPTVVPRASSFPSPSAPPEVIVPPAPDKSDEKQ
jgi:outer membrane protein TolC